MTLEGLIESYVASLVVVFLPLLLIAFSIASMLLFGVDAVAIALGIGSIAWLAVAWWRLSRQP